MHHSSRLVARLGTALMALFFAAGCQTPRHKEFAEVREGMDKSEVLEAAGNPNRTQRWQGKDRWIYVYKPEASNIEVKEVHFQEGRVVYRGNPIPPAVSAEEQDLLNEEANQTEEAKLQAERDANREAVNSGLEPAPVDESLKRAPRFEPID